MAAEKAQILSVRNDIVQVAHQFLEGMPESYLIYAADLGDSTVYVKSNLGFEVAYLLLGDEGEQQSEIIEISSLTPGDLYTVATGTLLLPHAVGTRARLCYYDQVCIYGSASASDTSPTLIGSATDIDIKSGYTQIKASTAYAYYYARYYDSISNVYSEYSDAVAAAGLSELARGEIKKEFLSMYNEKVDDLITEDWMNRTINSWQRMLLRRRPNWSCLRAISYTDLVQDQALYSLPSDIASKSKDAIVSVKYYNQAEINYLDQSEYLANSYDWVGSILDTSITTGSTEIVLDDSSDFASSGNVYIQGDEIAYTGNTTSTGTLTGVTGIATSHTAGDEVWQTYTTGDPAAWTINGSNIELYPVPGSGQAGRNLTIEYWKAFPDLDDDSDETLFPDTGNCLKYFDWQLSVRRKLPINERRLREQIWREDMEELVAADDDFRDINIQPNDIYNQPY